LEGTEFELSKNDGDNCLHGGVGGFDTKNWSIEAIGANPDPFVLLHYRSLDQEDGFPGTLDVWLRYHLKNGRTLGLEFEARSDRATRSTSLTMAFSILQVLVMCFHTNCK
jgi:aldose 1-epimerase